MTFLDKEAARRQRRADALDLAHRYILRLAREHDHVLIAAIAHQRVIRIQAGTEHRGDLLQDLASQRMSVGIHDLLEMVQVDENQRRLGGGFDESVQLLG